MKQFKNFIIMLFCMIVVFALTLVAGAADKGQDVISPADYAALDDMWDEIEEAEVLAQSPRRLPDMSAVQMAYQIVLASDTLVDGSIQWLGEDDFCWETTVGVTCRYSSRLRQQVVTAPTEPDEMMHDTYDSVAQKGTGGAATDVVIVSPYYGIDSSFTTQYSKEGAEIAETTGGECYVLVRGDATIDAIADAVSNAAVVVFDSHGDTNYANGTDYVTGATTSYLCLQTGEGLTVQDYAADENGIYHAYYAGRAGNMYYYEVDGTVISNHMEKEAEDNMLWMSLCLGMATEGLCTPLREAGVDTVYGYTNSVTFVGDYAWESVFWDEMMCGSTVADAIDVMKQTVGYWDPGFNVKDYNLAVANELAFPVVVSPEDPYPTTRYRTTYQSVYSDWTLPAFSVTAAVEDTSLGTLQMDGRIIKVQPVPGYEIAYVTVVPENAVEYTQDGNVITIGRIYGDCTITIGLQNITQCTVSFSVPAGNRVKDLHCQYGENITLPEPAQTALGVQGQYTFLGWTEQTVMQTDLAPTYLRAGEIYRPAQKAVRLYALYAYSSGGAGTYYATELDTGEELWCSSAAFYDLDLGKWYHEATDFAIDMNLIDGYSDGSFRPNYVLTRAMAVTILWRLTGEKNAETPCHYSDVEEGRWYTDAVAWANEKGVVLGYPNGEFRPNNTITREEIAVILYRYNRNVASKGSFLQLYRDASSVSSWALEAMNWACGKKIISGYSDDTLRPKSLATRAEFAMMLMRYCGS